jgi:hypothetical protein
MLIGYKLIQSAIKTRVGGCWGVLRINLECLAVGWNDSRFLVRFRVLTESVRRANLSSAGWGRAGVVDAGCRTRPCMSVVQRCCAAEDFATGEYLCYLSGEVRPWVGCISCIYLIGLDYRGGCEIDWFECPTEEFLGPLCLVFKPLALRLMLVIVRLCSSVMYINVRLGWLSAFSS